MIRFLLLTSSFISLFGCTSSNQEETAHRSVLLKEQLLDCDRQFSKMSEEKGLRAAYLEYVDSNIVLLKPNSLPIASGYAIDFITQLNDRNQTMSWVPKSGFVSESGDLGYTYGLYSIKSRSSDSVHFGTYLSLWKRHSDSTWKLAVSTGNEGIE